ncbi:hypothetical protein PA25_21900 [Pseudoalteromonas sp. A25]|uniref:DUF6058 family natural product biosynthesis protein n=1 Tax=Pseudoalteromonas sp. A25 TaxID=116092 RepID=UPI0012A34E4C|nr:DUF6058 family natural product biosynthesis protein [Pseudoalteromonas sp. A25]BBN82205.1 hypothetical protein PA25_21900 [Pseudoalteromonas sp. A25]
MPEGIAAKELAILKISEIIEKSNIDAVQLKRLERAVNLLGSVSALFGPHEREKVLVIA